MDAGARMGRALQKGDDISMSLMELGRRMHAGDITLEDALREMKLGSCSVLLSWSEDEGELWGCSWVVGGVRYTGLHPQPRKAVLKAIVEYTNGLRTINPSRSNLD